MYGAIPNLAASVSGAHAASKVAQNHKSRERDRAQKAEPPKDKPEDVVEVVHADPVRRLKDPTQEEAQEDHQEHPAYGADGHTRSDVPRRRIDLEG